MSPATRDRAVGTDNQGTRLGLAAHRRFLLDLRRRPAAAVALVLSFMVLAVVVVALPSQGSAKFWHPAMTWAVAALAISAAAYLTAAVYLAQEPQETMGSSSQDRQQLAEERASGLPKRGSVTGPVLMLDLDGVLHMGQSGRLNKLPMLQQWLYEHPSVQVVISSDWRYTHGFEQVRDLFDERLRDRIIGATPVREGAPREEEILEVVRHCEIRVWAALDDVESGFPTTAAKHLVRTNPLFGISESDLVALAERLGV